METIAIDPENLDQIILDDVGDKLEAAYEENIPLIKEGELIKGKVVKIEPHEILIDVGYKAEGVILLKELAIRQDISPEKIVSLGEEIEAIILQKEDRDGRLILSKKRAQYEKAWLDIEKVYKEGGLIKGVVIETVRGGLIVDIGLRGFLPASLVDLRRVTKLDDYVNQEIEAKILELDRQRSNVVLSRRAWLEETQKEEREELLQSMMPGDIKEAVISSVVDFGAFVDLGLMDGLIHVSELSWKRINHPSDVVTVGDKVKVKILAVDSDKERIALSLKATEQGPWVEFAKTHNVGDLIYGKVMKLVEFGAFIKIEEDIEGLVHISELATHRIQKPEEIISPGEELWVKIIEINASRRRISLSIKQAQEGEEEIAAVEEAEAEIAEETEVEAEPVEEAEIEEESTEEAEEEAEIEEEPAEEAEEEAEIEEEPAEEPTEEENET